MDVDEICRLVWRAGGAVRRGDLPCDWRALDRALASGKLLRLARGTYVLSSQQPAQQAAARLRGVVSHTSAAQLWLMEVVSAPVLPHVTVPRSRKLSARDVVRHWADLPPADVEGGVTTPLRTVVDCARSLQLPDALAVADSALRRGLVRPGELRARAEATRGAGRAAVQRVAQHASGRAANPFESALRGIAVEAGVLGLEPQVVLECVGGRVRPDLLHRRLRLMAEADSFEWHGRRRALADDCRRYDDLVADGWTVLRFAWEQVMFDRPWVSRTLRATAARCAVTADVQKSLEPAGSGARRPPLPVRRHQKGGAGRH